MTAKRKLVYQYKRATCTAFAEKNGYQIIAEYSDDGVTGKLPMHARPQGKLLIAALLADGIKTVLCYDAKRIGRTQPSFWSFIGLCRDSASLYSMQLAQTSLEASWVVSTVCWQSLTATPL